MNPRRVVAHPAVVLFFAACAVAAGSGPRSDGLRALRPQETLWLTQDVALVVEGPSPETGHPAPAQREDPPAHSPATSTAAPPQAVPKLTVRQRAELVRDLPDEERQWLNEYVAPIILPEERDVFLQLALPYQREAFKGDFWKRRERDGLPPPLGPGYETRYRHLREIAAEEYDGINSDAGRMVVRSGEPVSIEVLSDCSEVYREAEIWSYPSGASSRQVRHLFYRPSFGAPRRLWLPGDQGIFQSASCISTFDQACASGGNGSPPASPTEPCAGSRSVPRTCRAACSLARVAQEISGHGAAEGSSIVAAPRVSTEGLESLWTRFASLSSPGAKPIAVEGSATSAPRAAAVPDEAPPRAGWSNEEIRARILALPRKYRDWLDLAGPLLSEPELVAFLNLPPGERDGYMRKFWKRHAHSK